jgi:nicotinic acid phosphoribosyltransferase
MSHIHDALGLPRGMSVSDDAPALDIAYKLSEYGGEGCTKLSRHKPILPGRKQIFRQEKEGKAVGEIIARAGEQLQGRPHEEVRHRVLVSPKVQQAASSEATPGTSQ